MIKSLSELTPFNEQKVKENTERFKRLNPNSVDFESLSEEKQKLVLKDLENTGI